MNKHIKYLNITISIRSASDTFSVYSHIFTPFKRDSAGNFDNKWRLLFCPNFVETYSNFPFHTFHTSFTWILQQPGEHYSLIEVHNLLVLGWTKNYLHARIFPKINKKLFACQNISQNEPKIICMPKYFPKWPKIIDTPKYFPKN